jgi:hypothetical protein
MEKLYLIVEGTFSGGFTITGPIAHAEKDGIDGPEVIEIATPEGGIEDRDGRAFLLRGDPILEGFEVIGPFSNIQDATAYGITKEEGNWWVFMAAQ